VAVVWIAILQTQGSGVANWLASKLKNIRGIQVPPSMLDGFWELVFRVRGDSLIGDCLFGITGHV
jgi:hypothetical protein